MIYLDNSSTTKPYSDVLSSYLKVAENYFGNPSSLHKLGGQAEQLLSKARTQISELLQVNPTEVIFTSGGSESNNLAIKGVAFQNHLRGKHIITTKIEHPSVSETCKQLEQLGFRITYLPVNSHGFINIDDLKNEICDDTILVSVIHVNNEIGSVQPVEAVGKLLKHYPKILFHIDHVQGVGKVPIDLKKANIDLCSISAHKFHGLKGNGILYVRDGIKLSPLIAGGSQEMVVRSGTENVAGIVAMAKALRLTFDNLEVNINKLNDVKNTYVEKLTIIPQVKIHSPIQNVAPHIINFSVPNMKAEVFVHMLEEEGIFVSTTSACSSKKKLPSKTLSAMGLDEKYTNSAIRISLSPFNDLEEVNKVMGIIKQAILKIESVMR
ncbi:cysteine desulfurase [Bacillus timonensis]|nr:cysteine desulfurase [Bacillus timonensis]